MPRTSSNKFQNLVHLFLGGKLPAERAEMRWTYVIHHGNDIYRGGSETEMSRRFWIRMTIHRNGILAPKKNC